MIEIFHDVFCILTKSMFDMLMQIQSDFHVTQVFSWINTIFQNNWIFREYSIKLPALNEYLKGKQNREDETTISQLLMLLPFIFSLC